MMKKDIVIIAGPSAVGKTTVAHAIITLDDRFEFVRSVTTRAPRGDAFDDEYIYITREEFLSLIPVGGVLEHTEYAGALYGTPRSEVERICSEGRVPLLVLDTNGVRSISRFDDIGTCAVYVYDHINVMEQRLYDRFVGSSPTAEGLRKFVSRRDKNVEDYLSLGEYAPHFYSFIENSGGINDTAKLVISALDSFCGGISRDGAVIDEIVGTLAASAEEKMK